jgi:hypothetical protein
MHSTHWNVRANTRIAGNRSYEEENSNYLAGSSHEAQVREVFGIAGIEYGRIDYGVCGDKIQVWEINTNPDLNPGAFAGNELTVPALSEAFLVLNARANRPGRATVGASAVASFLRFGRIVFRKARSIVTS